MTDSRITNLADILVNYSTKVQPGNWVIINGDVPSLLLCNAVVEQVMQADGHPSVLIGDDTLTETIMRFANMEQLQWISPLTKIDLFLNKKWDTD